MPLTPFKLDIVRGIRLNIKAYVGDTGCSIQSMFLYRAIGSFVKIREWVKYRLGGSNGFKITYYDAFTVEHDVKNDRDLFEAFKTYGMDSSIIIGHEVIFHITHKDKGLEQNLGEQISALCIKKADENKSTVCHFRSFNLNLLPDIYMKCDYDFVKDIQETIGELEKHIETTSLYIRTLKKNLEGKKKITEDQHDELITQKEKLFELRKDLEDHQKTLKFLNTM